MDGGDGAGEPTAAEPDVAPVKVKKAKGAARYHELAPPEAIATQLPRASRVRCILLCGVICAAVSIGVILHAAASIVASFAPSRIEVSPPPPPDFPVIPSTIRLRNGVELPRLLLGTGATTWMNENTTEAMVRRGLKAGFLGIDTANHYRNHAGVRRGMAAARAEGVHAPIWLQTKIEGCGNSVDPRSPVLRGSCEADTLRVFRASLEELGVPRVDLVLLHSPPCVPGAAWVDGCIGNPAADLVYPKRCDCSAPEPCEMMQQQWRALEVIYRANHTRAIGVSNYCAACLECIARKATVAPHVNQLNFHAGMPGSDPSGLLSATEAYGTVVQAYRPLAHGEGSLLHDPTVRAIASRHGKGAAQVALRWVMQLGHALVTSTESVSHMATDLDVFDWALSHGEMQTLSRLDTSPDDPTTFCVL